MRIITLIFLISSLVSCSKPSTKPPEIKLPELDNAVELAPIILDSILDNNDHALEAPSSAIDFGHLEYDQASVQEIYIRNNQMIDLNFVPEDVDSSQIAPFVLVSNSCSGVIQRAKRCLIKIRLENKQQEISDVDVSSNLIIKNLTINLIGKKLQYIAPTAPEEGISIHPLNLNFGNMEDGHKKYVTVIVNNKSLKPKEFSVPVSSNSKINVINNCPLSIESRKSCSLRFQYNAEENEMHNEVDLFPLLRNQLKYSVTVDTPTIEEPELIPRIEPLEATSSVALLEPAIGSGTIQFKNIGINFWPGPIVARSSHPSIEMGTPSCSSGLSRNRICTVSFTINSALAPAGISNQAIRIQSGIRSSLLHNLTLNVTKSAPVIAFNTIETTPSCSSLNLQVCDGTQNIARTHSCQKLVNGVIDNSYISNPLDCSLADSSPVVCSSPAGEKIISILNGTKTVSCPAASSTETLVSIVCNSILREPNEDNTACIDKDPGALTIDFENEYTKQITNKIIASSQNAQEIHLYTQSSCIGSFTNHALPLSHDIVYMGSQGVVTYSAKFLNGTSESACIDFSYTYDTQAQGNLILTGLPSGVINNINQRTLQLSSSGDLIGAKIILSSTACSSLVLSDFDSQPSIPLTNNYQITPIINATTNFCAIGYDRANNWQSTINNIGSMSTDLVPPTNIISVNHPNFFNSTTQTPMISWTASSDTLSGINRYEISIGTEANLQDVLSWTSVNMATSYQGNVDLSAHSEDILYANIRSIDNAGNISAVKVSPGWFVGQPIVDLSISYPTSSDRIKVSNVSGFRIAGICSEKDSPVLIQLGNIPEVGTNCEINPADEEGLGIYETFINASTLPEGAVSLTVTHSNALPFTRTLNVLLIKDTVAPIVSVTSPLNNSSYEILNNRNFTFNGTCNDPSAPVTITSSIAVNGSVTCSANSTFSFVTDLSDYDIPSLSFTFRQTDLSGNLSNIVSVTLKKGSYNRILTSELDQIDYPVSTISTLLGTNTGKVAHLISANNDSEGALAISNTDGSEYIVLTPAVGNAGVSMFSTYQGQANDRLAVFNPDTETIYFRQRIPNSNAIGIYEVSMDGSNYKILIGGENATHADWEVVQFSLTQNRDKILYISDEEVDDVFELYSMDLDGSNRVKLNTALSSGGNVVAFYKIPISGAHPERVLYYADQLSDNRFDLFLANVSGENITGSTKVNQVTPTVDSYVLGEVRDVLRLRITANGQYVVFSHAKKALNATTGAKYYSLFSTYLLGATPTIHSISNTAAGRELYNYGAWHVSPSGTRIAYVDDTTADGVFHVYTCTITGGSDIRVTPDLATSRDYVYVRWHNDVTLFIQGDAGTNDGFPNIYRVDGTKAYNASNGYRALTNITASYSQVVYSLATYYANGVEMEQSNAFRTAPDGRLLFICDLSSSTASQNQLCAIPSAVTTTSTITSLTSTHRINPSPSNITTDVPAFMVSPTTPAKVTYLFDAVTDGMYDLYVATLGTTTNLKVSNNIDYSAGSVFVLNNYFSVDWANNVAVYTANDFSPNRYAFTTKLDGSKITKIGDLMNVSDVEATLVVGNKVVFLADLDVPNQSELYSANSDGTNLQKISAPLGSNATILNTFKRVGDTNKIVYVSSSGSDRASELRMIDLTTNVDTLLSTGSQINTEIESFAFNRALTYVVYIADRATDEVNELWASKLDGTGSPFRLNPSGWTTGQDVIGFTIAPDSNTVAVLHDALNTDNKWVYHITKILTPTTWVNVTANSTANVSASLVAVAPAVFNSTSTTVCFSGDLVTNSDFDLFCSAVTGSPLTTPIVGGSETDTIRNVSNGSLMTNPSRDRVIYKGNMGSDSQFNFYSVPFAGGTIRTLTATGGNNKQIPYSNTAVDIIGVNQERFTMFYNDNFIFRADAEVDEKFELYMSSVFATTTTALKLNQTMDSSNDVYSYLIIGDKVAYLADVGLLPRLLYATNLTGTPTQTLLTSFDNPEGNVLNFYPGGDLNSTYIGINATGSNNEVVDCYLAKIDGSNFRKLSPNLSPDTVGCERALVDNSELNMLFQADVFNFGVLDLFKQ